MRITWAPGRTIPATVTGPADSPTVIVLAHGAGAGPDHPFMRSVRDLLAGHGVQVVTFPYPYVAEGRRAPDRLDTLLAAHRAVVARAARAGARLVLAGKSMGGRVSSHLGDVGAAGFVFLGYPLVPIGKTVPRDTSHLMALRAPMLFLQGERDRLAPLGAIRRVVAGLPEASIVVIPDADHSFKVPKRSGIGEAEMLDHLVDLVTAWGPLQAGGGV